MSDELEQRIRELEWQVANWERKAIRRAVCCDLNERAARTWKALAKRLWIRSGCGVWT